jgi:hypothetical protein
MRKLIRNIAECPTCHDVIESKHVHDLVQCKCKAIFVDGGTEYMRRVWSGPEPIDRSVYEEDQTDEEDVLTSEEPW